MKLSADDFASRARALRWLLLDVDGVLTDGRLFYVGSGEDPMIFHVRDGLAIKLAREQGLGVGILSGRGGPALDRRVHELGLDPVVTRCSDKGPAFEKIVARLGLTAEQVAYVGDDLQDLPAIRRCGLSFCPADAAAEVRAAVDVVLSAAGGHGAIREMIELILSEGDRWRALAQRLHDG
ncbi:MAG: HAD family hydrolase [Acidobacteriota bacterium]